MQAIGIDIGTTSICGVVIDPKTGEVLKSITKNSNAFLNGAAWEKLQSVDKIISIANGLLDALITEHTVAIGVTGQMHGIVYTDQNGKAVSPLYTWQDGRGNLPYQDTTYAAYLNSSSGYGNVTDFYNRTNGLVPKHAVNYCTIHDYFVMQLCGLKKAKLHVSDAASLGCFDPEHNRFAYDCDIDVTTDYRIAGSYQGIPVGVAIGDNQASVFSSLTDENKILLNVGTGSQVSVISDHIVTAENIETRPYFENKYLVVGAALCGGRAYSALKDFYAAVLHYATEVKDDCVYQIMEQMLGNTDRTSLRVDTRFSGTRADQNLRGSITGISTENFKPEELTYGVLEGMISELYEMYRQMKVEKSGIIGSGNGIRKNKALVKIAEQKFHTPLAIPRHTEEAAFGAALFALIAAGHLKDGAEAQALVQFL